MSKQSDFIDRIAPVIVKQAKDNGYKYPSAIIAQAILESGWGESQLARYYNFFGMKAGSGWTGKVVTMKTQEQTTSGFYYDINACFRAYDTIELGIAGYFQFLQYPRYNNLKSATSPRDYLEKIKADGYATSIKYVDNVMRVVDTYNLTKYDSEEVKDEVPEELKVAGDVFARYCVAGLLGNGEDRKNRIYRIVQNRVNLMVK